METSRIDRGNDNSVDSYAMKYFIYVVAIASYCRSRWYSTFLHIHTCRNCHQKLMRLIRASYKMSRIKWSRILMSRIEPIARLKSSRQKPAIRYAVVSINNSIPQTNLEVCNNTHCRHGYQHCQPGYAKNS